MQVELSDESVNYVMNLLAQQKWFEADKPLREFRQAIDLHNQTMQRKMAEQYMPKEVGDAVVKMASGRNPGNGQVIEGNTMG